MDAAWRARDGEPVEEVLDASPSWSAEAAVREGERDYSAIHELVMSCQGLVRSLAWQIRKGLPPWVELDDLISLGNLGLSEAAQRFRPDQGDAFSTYAYYRVRGAILDGLSKMTWFRLQDYPGHRYERLANELLQLDTDQPGDASSAGTSVEESARWFRGATARLAVVCLAMGGRKGDTDDALDVAADPSSSPQARAIQDEIREKLHDLIAALPEEAGSLVRGVYYEGLTLEAAGLRLGISKAWASRLHAKTLDRLARALRKLGIEEE